ncbi:hypothetical protein EV182_006613, partial [Spiromyces aspiralis]
MGAHAQNPKDQTAKKRQRALEQNRGKASPNTATSGRLSTHTHRSRTGHSRAITERGDTTKEWADEHEREAKLVISEGCIRLDVDEVFDLLRPRNLAVAAHASHIAADTAGQLDSLSLSSNEKGVEDILSWIAPPSPHEAETTTTTTNNAKKEKSKAAVFTSERPMYPCIIAFINFVAKK